MGRLRFRSVSSSAVYSSMRSGITPAALSDWNSSNASTSTGRSSSRTRHTLSPRRCWLRSPTYWAETSSSVEKSSRPATSGATARSRSATMRGDE